MTSRSIILGLLVLFLGVATAPAQQMIIHTTDGESSFNLADVDSITFTEEEEGPQAGDERDFQLTEDVTITMVWIPAGEFMMGAQEDEQDANDDEYPRHRVTFDYGFWMGKYEVTQAQWEAVMGDNPAQGYGVGDDHPVYPVTWDDIQNFESELDDVFRLPSESEWEYACRAGTDTRFYWGDDPDYEDINDYAVHTDNDPNGTDEVGTKRPNAWCLYDMSGNVWEWCEDDWPSNYNNAPNDGSPWINVPRAGYRILRGGAWNNDPEMCRSAYHAGAFPDLSYSSFGFRLVRDAD